MKETIIKIGYYTVLCTIWKYIVRVSIVLKTRIGLDATGVSSNTIRTSTIYFHIVHNTVLCPIYYTAEMINTITTILCLTFNIV